MLQRQFRYRIPTAANTRQGQNLAGNISRGRQLDARDAIKPLEATRRAVVTRASHLTI